MRIISLNTKQYRLFDFKQRSIPEISYDAWSERSYGDVPYGALYGRNVWLKVARKIRIRDNCQCQLCWAIGSIDNKTGVELDVHHINYKRRDHSDSNLIALCKSCHFKTGTMRTAWQIRFKEIMILKDLGLWTFVLTNKSVFYQMELFSNIINKED